MSVSTAIAAPADMLWLCFARSLRILQTSLQSRDECDQLCRRAIDVVARDPLDGVPNGLPRPLLARVLLFELVVLRAVGLDDPLVVGPGEVGLFSVDAHVDLRGRRAGVAEELEGFRFGVRAAAAVGDAGV